MKWDLKILDAQCESTKKLMEAQNNRSEDDDKVYFQSLKMTPISMDAQCLKEDGTVDLNVRNITQEEADFHQGVRQVRGAVIESRRNERSVSKLSEEKKERAIQAFMGKFSLDAIKHRFKNLMESIFKPQMSYAQMMAEEMRKDNEN